jgi:hypothetical protein
MMDAVPSLEGVLLLEYQQLKEEQRLRIGIRDNLLCATIGVLAMAVAGAIQLGATQLLLLTPPACLVLGWTYLVNDNRITAIGRHVQTVLGPQLASLLNAELPIFGWESLHRKDRWRRARKRGQLAVDLLIFCTTAQVAMIVVWVCTGPTLILAAVTIGELAGNGLLAFGLTANSRVNLLPDLGEQPFSGS